MSADPDDPRKAESPTDLTKTRVSDKTEAKYEKGVQRAAKLRRSRGKE